MKPILYPAGETQFRNNGIGRLSEATKCLVTEERNGQYELEMQYPVTGRHYKEIVEERIIAAKHDDTDDIQPFRIYKITRPMNGIVTVSARHITYQLSKVAVMPFEAGTCAEALAGLITNSVGDCPFNIWTDKLLEAHYHVDVPSSFRSLLGGVSGSILDVYGPGEYEWDRFTVKFHTHRGSDQNVYIRYGKNMTDVKKTTDTSNLWTGILPYWAGTDETEQAILVTLPEKVIYSDYSDDYVYRMVVPVDFSASFETQPTVEQLRSKAQTYVRNNAADGIPASIDVSFIALWQTEEYKDWAPLQKLKLCDTVTVYHKGLGIENKAKIVSVTYDVILERYEKMTIGEVKSSLGDSIRQISEEIKKEVPTNASVSQAISLATNILSGSLGGNIVIHTNAKGQPVEILSMDTADIQTAVKILKIDSNGISVSGTGYSGAFSPLIDMDGEIQGLGGAAYTDSSAYAASGHRHAASDITSGTLPVSRGGTGTSSLAEAASSMFQTLPPGTSNLVDTDSLVAGNSGSVVKRTLLNLWGYIKGKADAVYAAAVHQHAASAITSGTVDAARLPAVSRGQAGIAPAPAEGQSGAYLRGDGTWASPAATAAPGNIAQESALGTSSRFALQDHTHGIDLASGDSDGQVKIAGVNVPVKGLGSAAYTDSGDYAGASHTHPPDNTKLSLDGGVLTGPLTAAKGFNILLNGTADAAQDKGSGANPRYFPARWTFDTGHTVADGDMSVVRIPGAGHSYGVYMSVDGGEAYYPVVTSGTSRLTTHFAANQFLIVSFDAAGSAASMQALDGSNSAGTVTGGVWRVLNFYDTNTVPSAYCSTAAATKAKAASCSGYALLDKSYLQVVMTASNTAADALTLNVNGRGAKPVYINGEVSSASNNVLPAGPYLVYYDGSSYHFRTDGKIPGTGDLAYEEAGADIETVYLPTTLEDGVPGGYTAYTVSNGILYGKEVPVNDGGGE